jgi:secondary thiamine-phosphate synthase enzyme
MQTITIASNKREELIDITSEVNAALARSGVREGLCHLFCRHTTAALTVNENADPDVKHDIIMGMERIVGYDWPYDHSEGNSPAHIKSSLLGASLLVPVADGRLALGRWQGVMFAEFDGPRPERKIQLTFVDNQG